MNSLSRGRPIVWISRGIRSEGESALTRFESSASAANFSSSPLLHGTSCSSSAHGDRLTPSMPSVSGRTYSSKATQYRPHPHEKLMKEMSKPVETPRNYIYSRYGEVASMGSYCTDMVVDPITRPSGFPGLANIFQFDEWGVGGRNRAWLEGLVQGWAAFSRTRGFEGDDDIRKSVLELYTDVHRHLADGHVSVLQDRVSPNTLKELTLQVRNWRNGGWAQVQWRFAEPPGIRALKILRRRVFSIDPKATKDSLSDPNIPSFAQITMKISTRHVFVALDKDGRVVAGDANKALPVEDVWVVEKVHGKTVQGNRWRLIKRYTEEELAQAGL